MLTIKAINRKPKTTKYGEKISVGILSEEYGDKWLNGWEDDINKNWKKGDKVDAMVKENGAFLNFSSMVQSSSTRAINKLNNQITEKKDDATAWGKCKTLFLLESFRSGEELNTAEPKAELWADACMRRLGVNNDIPTIDYGHEISPEEIPF